MPCLDNNGIGLLSTKDPARFVVKELSVYPRFNMDEGMIDFQVTKFWQNSFCLFVCFSVLDSILKESFIRR